MTVQEIKNQGYVNLYLIRDVNPYPAGLGVMDGPVDLTALNPSNNEMVAVTPNGGVGGSRWLIIVLFSFIGGLAGLSTVLFYEEPSILTAFHLNC